MRKLSPGLWSIDHDLGAPGVYERKNPGYKVPLRTVPANVKNSVRVLGKDFVSSLLKESVISWVKDLLGRRSRTTVEGSTLSALGSRRTHCTFYASPP